MTEGNCQASSTSTCASEKLSTIVSDIDTIIFVDIDGVLNVGAAEDGKSALLFNDKNLAIAMRLCCKMDSLDRAQRQTVEKLKAISGRRLDRGEETGERMSALAAKDPSMVSEVLVRRFAQIVDSAGTRCMIVLTSTWQAACFRARVEDLERWVSRLLGRAFAFDASTHSEAITPEGRLKAIGDFVAASTAPGGAASKAADAGLLRIVVLEDFFATPLSGEWSCGGRPMDSEKAVESYINSKLPRANSGAVALIHTYDEWTTSMQCPVVRCGVGISADDVQRAKRFLARGLDATLCKNSRSWAQPGVSEASDADNAGCSLFGFCCLGVTGHVGRKTSSSALSVSSGASSAW